MAKKQTKEKNPPALELKDILAAIDLGAKDLWDQFDDDQKKCVSFFTLNRFISSVRSGKREVQEHFVLAVNEYYNKHYFSLSKHPKLLWMLLCCCAYENKGIFFHEYIRLDKNKTQKTKILEKLYPTHKLADIETMSNLYTLKEVMELAGDHGWDDKTIKEHL
jgi:hypothetical protein